MLIYWKLFKITNSSFYTHSNLKRKQLFSPKMEVSNLELSFPSEFNHSPSENRKRQFSILAGD